MSTADPETAPDSRQSPGQLLAAARVAQQLLVEDVARQLRLSPAQIVALESDDYTRLHAPVFARGFVRSYAKLLKLDPQQVLALMHLETPAVVPLAPVPMHGVTLSTRSRPNWIPYVAAFGLLIAAAFAYYQFVLRDVGQIGAATNTSQAGTEQKSATTTQVPVTLPVIAAPVTTPVKADQPPQAEATAPARALQLVFATESWVEIKDRDEKVLLSQMNAPGSEQKLSGLAPLSLVIGSAQGVRLTVDGKPVDLNSYSNDGVARLKLE